MKYLKIIGGVILVILAVYGVYSMFAPKPIMLAGAPQINSNSNMSHFTATIYAGGGVVDGGGSYSTSTLLTTDQLSEGEVSPNNLILFATPTGGTTLTLPTFSQNGLLANVGDETYFFIQNATTTAASLTIAAPTLGTTINMATTSAIIPTGFTDQIDCVRLSTATTTCFIQ